MQSNDTRFPVRGDNFDTLAALDGGSITLEVLEALSFVHDYEIALSAFTASLDSVPVQEFSCASDNT